MTNSNGKVLPPVYFLLALVAMAALHYLWPVAQYLSFPGNLIGLLPLGIGVGLNIVAEGQFKRHQTTVKPFRLSSALLTGFPFSVSRNPMYVGMALLLAGIALLLGTVTPWLPAVAFPILLDLRFVRVEERMLAETFGSEWEQYRARVRRWL
jgi:protein-S-isoprenylcysteine O-methyltransferase Ste14